MSTRKTPEEQAREHWGDLVVSSETSPDGGLTVQLTGGERVRYWPDGQWAVHCALVEAPAPPAAALEASGP